MEEAVFTKCAQAGFPDGANGTCTVGVRGAEGGRKNGDKKQRGPPSNAEDCHKSAQRIRTQIKWAEQAKWSPRAAKGFEGRAKKEPTASNSAT